MLMLPAPPTPPPPKRGVAIKRYCDQRREMARVTEILYMPPWTSSTLQGRQPEPEIVPVDDTLDVIFSRIDAILERNRRETVAFNMWVSAGMPVQFQHSPYLLKGN